MKHDFQAGLSLIEALVVSALFSLVMLVVIAFLGNGFIINRRVVGQIYNQRIARSAIDKITRELREITTGDNNQYPLVECGALSITFYSDYDIDDATERVRYFVEDGQLKRGTIEPVGVPAVYASGTEVVRAIVDDVLNDAGAPLFYYYPGTYSGSGVALTQPVSCSVVRLIEVNFKVDTIIEKQPGPFFLNTKIQLRNLKNNL